MRLAVPSNAFNKSMELQSEHVKWLGYHPSKRAIITTSNNRWKEAGSGKNSSDRIKLNKLKKLQTENQIIYSRQNLRTLDTVLRYVVLDRANYI